MIQTEQEPTQQVSRLQYEYSRYQKTVVTFGLGAITIMGVASLEAHQRELSKPQAQCIEQDCGQAALRDLLASPLEGQQKSLARPVLPNAIRPHPTTSLSPLLAEVLPKSVKASPQVPAGAIAEQKNLLADEPISIGNWGVDVSWPQCQAADPKAPIARLPVRRGFAIVGINHGKESNTNSCLSGQLAYAKKFGKVALYVNAANPFVHNAEKYGEEVARADIRRLEKAGADPNLADYEMVWIDVETGNYWRKGSAWSRHQNAEVVAGMVVAFRRAGAKVGIYSIGPMFHKIVGEVKDGTLYGLPEWHPTGYNSRHPQANCSDKPFAHGEVVMIQGVKNGLDSDIACPKKAK